MAEWWDNQPELSFSADGDDYLAEIIADMMREDFVYDSSALMFQTQPGAKSLFDHQFESSWSSKISTGCFRYKLQDLKTNYLQGHYKFVVQLNEDRATQRRMPQLITDILMPFNPDDFHFGKVPDYEKMFDVCSLEWGIPRLENKLEKYKHSMIVNVSPLEYCHSLFVPHIELCYPQVLNFDALRAAVEMMLASGDSYMRMGYNSLGAYASVNHMHFHMYSLRCKLYLETAPVEKLFGPCHYMITYPAEGFAFEITCALDICNTVRAVMILVELLIRKKIPHNVFITRGTPLSSNPAGIGLLYRSLRIYVWGREPYYGLKVEHLGFNLAVCELSGHFPIKDQLTYNTIDEDVIIQSMRKACHEVFVGIREEVNSLFTNRFDV